MARKPSKLERDMRESFVDDEETDIDETPEPVDEKIKGDVRAFRTNLIARDTVKFRDSVKAKTDTTPPLHRAAANGDVSAIESLIAGGADIDDIDLDRGEVTPLHVAAGKGHTSAVEALLRLGADHSVGDIAGNRPLHLAAVNGHGEVARALLDGGADPMRPNGNGRTALHQAALRPDDKVLEVLLAHPGTDINTVDAKGETALATAARKGNREGVAILQAHQADLNKADGLGRTPLRHATDAGDADMVGHLVTGGADATITDTYGDTPLHAAAKEGNAAVAEAIVASVPEIQRADVLEQPDADGMTAEQSATAHRHPEVAQKLGNAAAEARTAAKTPPMRRSPFGGPTILATAATSKPAAISPARPPDQARAPNPSLARRSPFGMRTIALTAPSPAVRAIVGNSKVMTPEQKTAVIQHAVATRRSLVQPMTPFERPTTNAEAVDAWSKQSAAIRKLAASPHDRAAKSLLTDAQSSECRQAAIHINKTNPIAVARANVHLAHAEGCRLAIVGATDAARAKIDAVPIAMKRSAVESTAKSEAAAQAMRTTETERVGMRM